MRFLHHLHHLHHLLHRHTHWQADDIGVFLVCTSWITRRAATWFTPDGDEDPVRVTDIEVMRAIVACDTAAEARWIAYRGRAAVSGQAGG